MALLGADTDELREVGQAFQEGKETTDQVIMFLKALIAILKAASFFSGGASAAYAQYLETTVVPWLERISEALGLFAKVLGTQADAQDQASDGGSVDMGSLPTYQTPQLPAPITPYQGEPLGGTPGSTAPQVPTDGTTPATPGTEPTSPATTTGPSLTIGENGHLMIDTGIDLDGPDGTAPATGTGTGTDTGAGATPTTTGPSTVGGPAPSPTAGGPTPTAVGGTAPAPTGTPFEPGNHSVGGERLGDSGAGTTGGTPSSSGSGSTPTGSPTSSPAPTSSQLGTPSIGDPGVNHANPATELNSSGPNTSSQPVADGGLGGATPGAESLGSSTMGEATPTGAANDSGPSYGAAAGIAGGAAALGLGGAALAARGAGGATGADPRIDQLAGSNGRGSRGEGVTELQERLTAAGYDTKGADGAWGKNTQAAYDAYRADHPLPVQTGQGYTSPSGYDYNQITGVRGNANVTPEFLRGVEGMAQRLGAQPEHIMAAMSFETGGSFASDVRNPRSSATGLIQFMDSTARGLGTTTDQLAQMTPVQQLDYVERYFEPYRGRLGDLESVYTSILAGSPHSGDDALFTQGDRAYGPNRELDVNRNGVITAAEATQHVRSRMGSGN
ncbi:hypothetical protein GCM10023340_38010 [Nocardioides marinquilinus]|uniref:Peptidoglycan binding-like domain-containing protein n=1 Tax=Nocardioides marinquilinus TaxID=1210400 RepID=A0ABP9PZX6_9ACTN